MILNATVRELSQCFAVCRFFHFLIYNSARFVYISFTFPFTLFFSFSACQAHAPAILIDYLRHEWQVIDFKQFFLAKTLAKTCHQCPKNGKSLIFKRIFYCQTWHELIKKCSSSNYYNVALLHTMRCYYI